MISLIDQLFRLDQLGEYLKRTLAVSYLFSAEDEEKYVHQSLSDYVPNTFQAYPSLYLHFTTF